MTQSAVANARTEEYRDSTMGRFEVPFRVTNYRESIRAESGDIPADQVHSTTINGVVDTGATRLVLPQKVVEALGLTPSGTVSVRYADRRTATRPLVADVKVELLGRGGVFSAMVEPDRETALIGAIVLEDLDFLVDCNTGRLVPRDPNQIVSEAE